ncbi:MAG TPA: type II toxin-antitoxin system VapC family toxin [Thermoanaerobaculia bacterium]
MAETVYLETTIPSYLAGRPSRDLVIAAHQQITHEWWNRAQERFELFISEAVLEEIRAGDPAVATKRLGVVAGLPVLELRQDVRDLVRLYSDRLNFPPQAQADVLHIAFAVSYGLDYLVTWNCKHIANGYFIRRLLRINQEVRRPTLSF